MRPESGVSLVSGALESNLGRAQRKYHFHGNNSLYNSEERKEARNKKAALQNKHLTAYCNSIGSSFASYSTEQFLQLGNSLDFDDGGFLERTIPDGIKKNCIILQQNQHYESSGAAASKKKLISTGKGFKSSTNNTSPLCTRVDSTLTKKVNVIIVTESRPVLPSSPKSKVSEILTISSPQKKPDKLDNLAQKIRKLLKDKTIGKNRKKNLIKKLRKSEVKVTNLIGLSKSPPVKSPTKTVAVNGCEASPLKKGIKTKMGPESLKPEIASTNGTSTLTSSSLQLPEPKRILYPKEKILLGWRSKRGPGAGFHNFGNTCYLNSSLQALFHIPAFVNWIQNDEEHKRMCKGTLPNQTTCIICVVYMTLQDHNRTSSAIRPRVLDKLKAICKHFSYGRQEDAHEFLRYLLEGMERSYLTLINGLRLDNRTKETNPLGQIFGGYIRTEVTCLQCHFVSTTFQPSAELQLDIRHSTTLEDALQQHFRRERLDNNDYRCEKCKKISQATKQFSLELPPLVLCLQLKRFTLYGNKIGKRIHCNKILNMSRYLHKSQKSSGFYQNNDLKYRLVALVTHLGQSPNCGHYTAIAEGSTGSYYQFDDQFVQEVTVNTALNNDAYLLVYEMERNSQPTNHSSLLSANISSKPCTSTSGALINGSPNTPRKFAVPFAKTNGISPALKPAMISNTDSKSNGPGSCIDRQVIRFGIPPNSLIKSSTSNKINVLQPGIAITNSARVYTNSIAKPKTNCVSLVPYGDIENDEIEQEPKEEIKKSSIKSKREDKIIGPMLEVKHKSSPSPSTAKPSSPSLCRTNNLENKFGVKRKLEEILGPTPDRIKLGVSPLKKPLTNSTSEWTISLNTGYSSEPESKKSKSKPEGFVRAKSAERTTPKTQASITKPEVPPLIPNSKNKLFSSTKIVTLVDETTTSGNSVSTLVVQNGHSSTKKKKRKRSKSSSSSSSSSSSDEGRNKRKKEEKGKKSKKEERKSSKVSSSSSSETDNNSSSADRYRDHKRHKNKKRKHSNHRDESKEKITVSNKGEVVNGWPAADRDASSVEREHILRRARNPSRSPSKSTTSSIDIFSPNKLGHEKAIVGWNGEESLLSKSIDHEKQAHSRKSRDEYEEELDHGRVKKPRISRSPSQDSQGSNKFQSLQDKKKLVSKWSKVLDGYGDGFKDHSNAFQEKKPWLNNRSGSDRPYYSNGGPPRNNGNSDFRGGRPRPSDSQSSSGYRGNNPRHNSYNNYNGNNQHRQYQKGKNWKGRNRY